MGAKSYGTVDGHTYMLKLIARILLLTAAIEGASLAIGDELILASLLTSA